MSVQTNSGAVARRLSTLIPTAAVLVTGALAFAAPALGAPNIATVAGTGVTSGALGDGGQATSAWLGAPGGLSPRDVTFMPDGSYLIADTHSHRIRRVSTAGVIRTAAGTTSGLSGDGGAATAAQFNAPSKAVPYQGGFLVADWGNSRIRFVDSAGIVSTVAGTTAGYSGDGGPATAAQLNNPRDIAVLPGGGYLIADETNDCIRQVDAGGTITTVAGTCLLAGFSGNGGAATAAKLNGPRAVSLTGDGGFLIADSENHRIRRVSPGGVISTAAGTGAAGFSGDGGSATSAKLNFPRGVSVTPDGGYLIADTNNNRIRRVTPGGTISTVAGSSASGFSGDGGPATSAAMSLPRAVTPAPDGGFLISDTGNARVRYVDVPPTLTAVSPDTALAGGPAVVLDVDGSGFAAASKVLWDGTALATTFVSSSHLQATVPAADLDTKGSFDITVTSGSVAHGTSGAQAFTVAAAPPLNSVLPAITGSAVAGGSLDCSLGTWERSPTAFAREWLRDGSGPAIATSAAYTVTAADAGHSLTCRVTATNPSGDTTATSAPVTVAAITAVPVPVPVPVSPPVAVPVSLSLATSRHARPGTRLSFVIRVTGLADGQRVTLQERRGGRWRTVRSVAITTGRATVRIRLDRRALHRYRVVTRVDGRLLSTSARSVTAVRRAR